MATHTLNKASTSTWEIDQSGDTWILGDNGSITGALVNGIHASATIAAATVRINGTIDLDGSASQGVFLESEMGDIAVSDTGHVSAGLVALYYYNSAGTITIDNAGTLESEYGIATYAMQGKTHIGNDGHILASDTGISEAGAGATIVNSGVIKAATGIDISSGPSDFDPLWATKATHVVNSGKITGSDYSVQVDAAREVAANIRNSGTLNGDVVLGDGEDTFNNAGGRLYGDLFMGGGNDVVKAAGGMIDGVILGGLGDDIVTLGAMGQVYIEEFDEGTDTVRINASYSLGEDIENLTLLGKADHVGIGNTLENVLIGNRGANALYGLYGNDRLDGGRGNDRLTGGVGIDTFVFKTGSGQDIVTDFEDGMDQIDLTGSGVTDFAALQTAMTQLVSGDVVITLNDHDRLIIRDMQTGDLGQFDFIFA